MEAPKVKIGDEVKIHNGTKMYVTYIEFCTLDGDYWYHGIETNGKAHIAVKAFLCDKTGRHDETLSKWISIE